MPALPTLAGACASAVALLSAALCAPAAHAVDLVNPAPLVEAFRTMCLTDFPDESAIGRRAVAAGWVERKVSLIGEPGKGMSATNLPRFFEWRGLFLSVSHAGKGVTLTSCQVSTQGAASLDTTALASATAAALGLGAPTRVIKRGSDLAKWQRAPGQIVQASADKNGRMRNVTLSIRLEPEQPRP